MKRKVVTLRYVDYKQGAAFDLRLKNCMYKEDVKKTFIAHFGYNYYFKKHADICYLTTTGQAVRLKMLPRCYQRSLSTITRQVVKP